MARNFKDPQAKMPPAPRARVGARIKQMEAEMPLEELRAAREMTQQQLAKSLRVDQSAISKLERRTDMYVSTLQRFVQAMGGQLEIRAVFPEGAVRISQFAELAAEVK